MEKYAHQVADNKLLIFVFLMMGVINTLAFKLQNAQYVNEGQITHKRFFHPYIQTFTMFMGQSLCIFAYRYNKRRNIQQSLKSEQKQHSWTIFIIPAISDGMSSLLQCTALVFTSASVYMIFKGSSIITTAFFSKILLDMKIQKRHIAGCLMAVIGLAIVGIGGTLKTQNIPINGVQQNAADSKEYIGYILLLISLIFNGFLYAYQQKIMNQYCLHPLELTGMEGIIGMIFLMSIIFVFSFISCDFSIEQCVFDNNGNRYMELPSAYFRQIFSSPLLFIFVLAAILTMAIYNGAGVTITKLFGGLTRSLLNVTRTAFLWVAGVLITIYSAGQQYQLQSLSIRVTLVKLVGFSSIIIGTLIYNQIIYEEYFPDTKLSQISTEDNYHQMIEINQNKRRASSV